MKRILALSISASILLGILSGCGVVQSNLSPEVYKKAIQAKSRMLVQTNTAALGQGYWSQQPVNTNNYQQYPQLWGALIAHILQFQATQGFTRESYPQYVALLTRFALVMNRPGNASFATGLNFGGLGRDYQNNNSESSSELGLSSVLRLTYFGAADDTLNQSVSSYAESFLGSLWH